MERGWMSFDILFFLYDYAGCVKSAVADRIRRHGYRLEIGCTLFHIISFLKGCSALTGGPKVVLRGDFLGESSK